jgi:hypothetical protein
VKCSNKGNVELIKEIKLEKYGDPNYNNTKKFKESIAKKSKEEKSKSLEKRRKTKELIYGDPNFTNTEKITESKKITTLRNINERVVNSGFLNVKVIGLKSNSSYYLYCNDCKKESLILNSRMNSRLRNFNNPCPICNNYSTGKSCQENILSDFIESLGFNVYKNDRKTLGGLEIDILIEGTNIGIEYNGLYWHSEMNVENNYHKNKQKKALDSGIFLINIWEDDLSNKEDIVKSKIKHILGKTENIIYARKCKIGFPLFKEAKDFLENNHIQGFCPYKKSIGLYHNGNLISIATFGRRKITGKSEYELLRFCNKKDHHIPGGFSKVIKEFTKNTDIERIITFADKSWSFPESNLYSRNGFEFIGESEPNYWYIVDKVRKHRFNYRKDILVKKGYSKDLTEREIMFELGYYRIYDCGQYKYELKIERE